MKITLYSLGKNSAIKFDLKKAKLIYFWKGKDTNLDILLSNEVRVLLETLIK
jgi:hypothetical protein